MCFCSQDMKNWNTLFLLLYLGVVAENSHALMTSPFKAFSPQPPKFFKPLMPVKEEHKRKTPLESRPLLSQEVIFESHLLFLKEMEWFCVLGKSFAFVATEFCHSLVKLFSPLFICGGVLRLFFTWMQGLWVSGFFYFLVCIFLYRIFLF